MEKLVRLSLTGDFSKFKWHDFLDILRDINPMTLGPGSPIHRIHLVVQLHHQVVATTTLHQWWYRAGWSSLVVSIAGSSGSEYTDYSII